MENYARRHDMTLYTSRLSLINVKENDAGKYQCIISNGFGSSYSKRSNVNVYGKVLKVFAKRNLKFV